MDTVQQHPASDRPQVSVRAHKTGAMLGLLLALALSSVSQAAEQQESLFDELSELARESITDRRQVGSIAGSLLGAALTTHPAGSILGGIFGFFAGKFAMQPTDEELAVPGEGEEGESEPAGAVSLAHLPATVGQFAAGPPLVAGLPVAGSDGRLVQLGAFEARASAERALQLLRSQGRLVGGSAISIHAEDRLGGDKVYRILLSPGEITAAAACDSIRTQGGSCAVVASVNAEG